MAKSKVSVPNVPKAKSTIDKSKSSNELLYGKEFYIWMLAGFLLIVIGFFLMAGGHQAPNEWNADEIYSTRRTVIAPLFMIAGLIVEVYAIFKK
jgi:hypothetical protein